MGDRQHASYMTLHDNYAEALYKRKKNRKNVRMLTISHRSLCQVIFDPNLQKFENNTLEYHSDKHLLNTYDDFHLLSRFSTQIIN